ncbi:MAG: hypothetical protein R6U68_11280, partial [Desulfobacteraceae bacterium]
MEITKVRLIFALKHSLFWTAAFQIRLSSTAICEYHLVIKFFEYRRPQLLPVRIKYYKFFEKVIEEIITELNTINYKLKT